MDIGSYREQIRAISKKSMREVAEAIILAADIKTQKGGKRRQGD